MTAIPDDALRETWESVYDKSVKLAALIEAHCTKTGEKFDAMVVVPRGAYYPANIISRELGFSSTDLLHACIGSYHANSTDRKLEFELGQMPTAEQIIGKHLLIIEEVCDTGLTLQFLIDYLQKAGAELIRTGVLHYKPALTKTGFQPDWAIEETNKWIVYPWEVHEQRGASSVAKR